MTQYDKFVYLFSQPQLADAKPNQTVQHSAKMLSFLMRGIKELCENLFNQRYPRSYPVCVHTIVLKTGLGGYFYHILFRYYQKYPYLCTP